MPTESKLHRLNDTLWSYIPSHEEDSPDEFEEIRLSVPTLENGRERFELVKADPTTFEANRDRLKRDFFRKGFRVVINDLGSPLAGTWDVGFERKACLSRRIVDQGTKSVAQFFPFCRTLTKRNMAVISVHQAKECAFRVCFWPHNELSLFRPRHGLNRPFSRSASPEPSLPKRRFLKSPSRIPLRLLPQRL